MNRLTAFVIALTPALAIAFAQNPAPQAGPATPAAPNTVIHIDVNLVQVDAVVTDSRGRRVTDLPSSAFEILQDGKPQAITNFAYVSNKPEAAGTASARLAAKPKPVKGEIPPPPPVLRPTDVRRTLALVVDDLGLAGENVPQVRSAIRNFVDEQMRPGDLVAIVRTGAGMGALQQFTTDKRLLYAALDRVKYGESRVGVSSFAPLGSGVRGAGPINHLREESLAVGTLGALQFVVNAMRGFPGRKSVVLFTENIRLIFQGTPDEMVNHAVQQLTDAASRASVVIHAIDPRGMPNYNLTAADNTAGMSRRRVARVPAQREDEVMHTEEGMFALAEETGGLFLHDTSDLAGALRKAAEDSDGYYLIGYHPDVNTFENGNGRPKFHRTEVKVKRSGLHVRSREGFFGEPGHNQPLEHTREAEIVHALQSPFTVGSIHPRLTAIFSNVQSGSSINALIYFDPKELKWSSEPDGNRKASIDVAAAAFDENGVTLAPIDTTFHMQLTAQHFDGAMKKGMVYALHIPVNKPGPYVVRAAVRDAATEGTGSADQYVEVPDVESGRLALSGIALQEAPASAPQAAPAKDVPQGPAPGEDTTDGAARRSFHKGTQIFYVYEIINAKNGASQKPDLEIETRLFHDGEQVMATGKTALGGAGATDSQRLNAGGRVSLGRNMTAGEYVLQVIVTDKLAKNKFNTATQSTDFEIEP
jgi:VWFA-related protein